MRAQPSTEYEKLESQLEELRSELRRLQAGGAPPDAPARATRRRRTVYAGIGAATVLGLLGARTALSDAGPAVTDALFIHPSGQVGIGTTTPQDRLDVRGRARFAGVVVEGGDQQLQVEGKSLLKGGAEMEGLTTMRKAVVSDGLRIDGGATIHGGVAGLIIGRGACAVHSVQQVIDKKHPYPEFPSNLACKEDEILVGWTRTEKTEKKTKSYVTSFSCCRLVVK